LETSPGGDAPWKIDLRIAGVAGIRAARNAWLRDEHMFF
jgi:hypothetical protein